MTRLQDAHVAIYAALTLIAAWFSVAFLLFGRPMTSLGSFRYMASLASTETWVIVFQAAALDLSTPIRLTL